MELKPNRTKSLINNRIVTWLMGNGGSGVGSKVWDWWFGSTPTQRARLGFIVKKGRRKKLDLPVSRNSFDLRLPLVDKWQRLTEFRSEDLKGFVLGHPRVEKWSIGALDGVAVVTLPPLQPFSALVRHNLSQIRHVSDPSWETDPTTRVCVPLKTPQSFIKL